MLIVAGAVDAAAGACTMNACAGDATRGAPRKPDGVVVRDGERLLLL